jgi:hypothetical protein
VADFQIRRPKAAGKYVGWRLNTSKSGTFVLSPTKRLASRRRDDIHAVAGIFGVRMRMDRQG